MAVSTPSIPSCCSVAKSRLTHGNPMDCSTSCFPVHHSLPEFAQTHVHWVSDAIQPSHPLPPPSPLALNLSHHQGLFQWVALFIRWPKYWWFSFNISPSNEYSVLITFRIDWFDLLADQGILKSLQHHSSKASIQFNQFKTRETIALTIWTFAGQVMSLLLNMLSRFVIAFLLKVSEN